MAKPSKWLDAIEAVLSQSDQPMTAEEIAREAIARQLVQPNSFWPEDTVRTAIQRHIIRDGNQRAFVVGGSTRLRLYWLSRKASD